MLGKENKLQRYVGRRPNGGSRVDTDESGAHNGAAKDSDSPLLKLSSRHLCYVVHAEAVPIRTLGYHCDADRYAQLLCSTFRSVRLTSRRHPSIRRRSMSVASRILQPRSRCLAGHRGDGKAQLSITSQLDATGSEQY